MRIILFILFISITFCGVSAQTRSFTGNPLLPGYFADPTIQKFDGRYYIYATTDGVKLASGEPTVWISDDLVEWYNYLLDIELPEGLNNCWAPDVQKGTDGKYYYYMGNCERGCNIYGYVSDSPMGPFTPINDGKPVIPVGTSREHLPALDAQFFYDDDNTLHSYFGTWCTSFGGMGYAKIDANDMFTIQESALIPISEIPHAFEAAYMLKHEGKYILMYSAGDCRLSTYSVHYAVSDSPKGPFRYGKNNPILETNHDGTVDSPGHHSILLKDNEYYMLYHRHDNPHSSGGEFRQVCIDKMEFEDDVTIKKIEPSHTGVAFVKSHSANNIARNCAATASSAYHLKADTTKYSNSGYDYLYSPQNAVDDDNGTMWKAASAKLPQSITLDLGKVVDIKRVSTQFEYATYYYQYKIETSVDGKKWQLFADKTDNRTCGMPMIDDKAQSARHIRITITGTEKTGVLPAIWNVKVYDELFATPAFANKPSVLKPGEAPSGKQIVKIDARKFKNNSSAITMKNSSKFGGYFTANEPIEVKTIDGVKAFFFNGNNFLKLSKPAPQSMSWNAPYTASAWVYVPKLAHGEAVIAWNSRENMLQSSYSSMMIGTGNYGAVAHGDGAVDVPYKNVPAEGTWNHIAITFDGAVEKVFVNGKCDSTTPISLFVENSDIIIGSTGEQHENLNGYIANVELWNKSMTDSEIVNIMNSTKPTK